MRKPDRLGTILATVLLFLAAVLLAMSLLEGIMGTGDPGMEKCMKLIKSLGHGNQCR